MKENSKSNCSQLEVTTKTCKSVKVMFAFCWFGGCRATCATTWDCHKYQQALVCPWWCTHSHLNNTQSVSHNNKCTNNKNVRASNNLEIVWAVTYQRQRQCVIEQKPRTSDLLSFQTKPTWAPSLSFSQYQTWWCQVPDTHRPRFSVNLRSRRRAQVRLVWADMGWQSSFRRPLTSPRYVMVSAKSHIWRMSIPMPYDSNIALISLTIMNLACRLRASATLHRCTMCWVSVQYFSTSYLYFQLFLSPIPTSGPLCIEQWTPMYRAVVPMYRTVVLCTEQ